MSLKASTTNNTTMIETLLRLWNKLKEEKDNTKMKRHGVLLVSK